MPIEEQVVLENLLAAPAAGGSYPLGATLINGGANFSVFSRSASRIELLFFDSVDDGRPSRVIPIDGVTKRTYHYWHVFVPDVQAGQIYGFRAYGPFEPARGFRFDPSKLLLDPYGRAIVIPKNYSREAALLKKDNTAMAMKSVVTDPHAYDWDGDAPLKRPWPDAPVRGSTIVVTWVAICLVLIPNRPWKSITAAISSAVIVPCAHLVAAHVIGYPALPWNRLLSYSLGLAFVAAWTPFISTRLQRLQQDLSRTQEFGSYRLEKLLGRGGMGEVWLARHSFLRRDAAVKLVLAELLERAREPERRLIQKRFESEAQAIASLRSPHTVEIYDYGLAENGSLYYAMEYLQGLDAETLVDRYGQQPAGRVVSLLRQACESLEEAHVGQVVRLVHM